ncbi:MAG TPA: pyruvate:ferredoxin (flavodoxin) oxidoreductase [Fimbriimonadaceae bacterium]|nr:pyruvate:ferredoxin (flavodoxin) oxidoreductase [Fimbriimonadaceae bacterium]
MIREPEGAASAATPATERQTATMDGNEAVAYVAYRCNEVCGIYPITPSSAMAEWADQWASEGIPNLWGVVPDVIEMQSEGGAAGAVHGALQAGALTTTFTASQGLLLMIPNMFKIAGELTPTVFHVAARSIATNTLSIFGDHQDVMAIRQTGFALLASSSVQEAHDMALVAQAATLSARIPFLHFFDGFRTSHEVNKLELIPDEQMRALIDEDDILAHRRRGMNPDHPSIRGTASNPDTYFQSREASNAFYLACPDIVAETLERFAALTGRRYRLFEYYGSPEAERVVVLMGSGVDTAKEVVDRLVGEGAKVGLLQVRLYRPFDSRRFLDCLPKTTKAIAVLDRTKEPGGIGEPLYTDVVLALGRLESPPRVIAGRYGLSSKEFTPAMVKAVYDELARPEPKTTFTIGIEDDVTRLSLEFDPGFTTEPPDTFRAVFYGLGADGTVGANKNTIKIIGEDPRFFAQGYFVYDSKKSGSRTVSHVRFGKQPIRSAYLIQDAHFVACHQFGFVHKFDVLALAAPGATFLLNSPHPPEAVWDQLPRSMQEQMIAKHLRFFVIDANKVAKETNMGSLTNTIMQTCFFGISGVLPREEAIEKIKHSIEKTYGRKGRDVVLRNWRAVDHTLAHLVEVPVPDVATSTTERAPTVAPDAPEPIRKFVARLMAGEGDLLPVSAMPIDGTFPSATSRWEKRNIAESIPIWDPETCVQCGNCGFVCPHSAIRAKLFHISELDRASVTIPSAPIDARGFPETRFLLQVYAEDCTGCGLCVQACPAKNPVDGRRKAINMASKDAGLDAAHESMAFFESLPVNDRAAVDFSTVRGVQFLEPTFEFSGACAGCGETPYLKLLSQLFGDRMIVANATGCSSIYGGNLPTTPWATNAEGRGPAWANSLFEDNAEFGLGMRLAADRHLSEAQSILLEMEEELGSDLVQDLIRQPQILESDVRKQRARVAALIERLRPMDTPRSRRLLSIADHLTRRSVWIVGGDGWAYDIGAAGLDHVLASGRNVNILVLDTEVYSNTGGQASKATPLAAVAKFATGGKQVGKKDLALQAISYGNVYVARIAMGASPQQTLQALREADAYPGTSLIIAYSHCIAHGIDMEQGLTQQQRAVHSGYWPLLRYNPLLREHGTPPFLLDSPRATCDFADYAKNELRYRMLRQTNPKQADALMEMAQEHIEKRWLLYEQLAQIR